MGSFHESREGRKEGPRSKAAPGALCAAGLSDPGCERESNEDRLLMMTRGDMASYFVFDGMGGQPAGEAAAQISADVIQSALGSYEEGDLKLFMNHVIGLAQEAILSRRGNPATEGMGTTVVGVVMRRDEVVIGAVGDSRAYHIKRGSVNQLTNDHTLVQQLVDSGQISPQDALVHPQSHILTRCIGSTLDFAVDSTRYRLKGGTASEGPREWLLLCSDGLYSLISDEEMAAVVLNFPPEEATQKLIAVARSRGGFDNITAVIIPLLGCLVDPSADCELPEGSTVMPALPTDLESDSVFVIEDGAPVHRGSPQNFRSVVLLGVLAVLSAAIWFAVFMMKQR